MKLEPGTWKPGRSGFIADRAFGSESADYASWGENVMFDGEDLVRAARNPLDVNQDVVNDELAYNVTLTADSEDVTGSGSSFLDDLFPFCHFMISTGEIFCVSRLVSNTAMKISPKPAANYTGHIWQVPNLHEINDRRASLLAGNVVSHKNALWAVGRGALKLDGADISESLTATNTPQVAYPNTNTSYDVRDVGFTRPAAPSATAQSGGTKAMPAGYLRSFRASKKRESELGYGPACDPVIVDMSASASLVIRAELAAYDDTEGQNRWLIWVTKDEVSTAAGGPWFEYGEVDADDIDTDLEWRSDDLGNAYNEDYTRQPDEAVCVAASGDILMWGSTLGIDASGNPSIPGDTVQVSSPTNLEGYPDDAYVATSNGEEIVSICIGKVQMYVGCRNTVQYAALTQGTQEPLVILPWIKTGIQHQYNMVMAGGIFVVFTDGALWAFDDRTLQENPLVARLQIFVMSLLKTLPAGRVFVGYDPSLAHLVLFCANYRQGANGGWQTLALSFDLAAGKVNCPVILGDGTDDFTVSGRATIGNHLEFVTTDGKVWRWEQGTGDVTGFLCSPFSAWGSNLERVTVRKVAVVGNVDGSISVVSDMDIETLKATELDVNLPTDALDNPTNAYTQFPPWSPNIQGRSHAARIDFTQEGGTRIIDLVEVGVVKRSGAAS